MTTRADCNHCHRPIGEVAYILTARPVDALDNPVPLGRPRHFHWDCLVGYIRGLRPTPTAEELTGGVT